MTALILALSIDFLGDLICRFPLSSTQKEKHFFCSVYAAKCPCFSLISHRRMLFCPVFKFYVFNLRLPFLEIVISCKNMLTLSKQIIKLDECPVYKFAKVLQFTFSYIYLIEQSSIKSLVVKYFQTLHHLFLL